LSFLRYKKDGDCKRVSSLTFILYSIVSFINISCGGADSPHVNDAKNQSTKQFRYFDRNLFFPSEDSVADIRIFNASKTVKLAVEELQKNTLLRSNYFIFKEEESSLLEPATEQGDFGFNQKSFIQIFPDSEFNSFLLSVAESQQIESDENVLSVRDLTKDSRYYMVFRLSCFQRSQACSFANDNQSKALVLRSFGYLVGLKFGTNSFSQIMNSAINDQQNSDVDFDIFYDEFDNQLEAIRNGDVDIYDNQVFS